MAQGNTTGQRSSNPTAVRYVGTLALANHDPPNCSHRTSSILVTAGTCTSKLRMPGVLIPHNALGSAGVLTIPARVVHSHLLDLPHSWQTCTSHHCNARGRRTPEKALGRLTQSHTMPHGTPGLAHEYLEALTQLAQPILCRMARRASTQVC